jgi:PKD repeat protein
MTRPTSFLKTLPRRRLTQPILETLEDRLAPAVVGYYDMGYQVGRTIQVAPIQTAGHTPVQIDDLTTSEFEMKGIDVLFVENPSNDHYVKEYLDHLDDIKAAVNDGMTLIIQDRYGTPVTPDETILPGGSGFNIIGQDFDHDINVLDNTTVLTNGMGAGGTIDDTTLDTSADQHASSHGYALAGSLPTDARLLLSTGDPNHVVTFSYTYGAGSVIYSTIPLDFYLGESQKPASFREIYAPNVIAYGVALHDNAPPVVAADQAAITVDEGASAGNTGTFADPDNDTVTLTASIGTVIDTGNGTWSWSFDTSDGPDNSQTVTITATDSDDASSTTFALTVNNVAPGVGVITAPLDPQQVDTTINVSAPFSDPGSGDTHTATWDWGDGTSSAGTISDHTVTANHTYTAGGVYTVTLSVADDDGGSGSSTSQYVVVYDPSAGFVTGGGWIDSPMGAYTADPNASGRAHFGFVAKYKKGQTTPDGNTEFRLTFADFTLKSTSYEWLVIAGAKAMFKGEGTINGAGSYGFQLTAWDGDASAPDDHDMFRIKIWDITNGVLYDNQAGADDDADQMTPLGGGSIVVHAGDALQAASLATGSPATAGLTAEQLAPIVAEAVARWEATGLSPEQVELLRGVQIMVGDLGGAYLGMEYSGTIWIDDDAAGWGWFVDTTPWDDSEFTMPGDQGEQDHMDLLTVVMHEMGHVLGLEDLNQDAGELMSATLTAGTRRLPLTGQVTETESMPAPDGTAVGFGNDWIFGLVNSDREAGSTPDGGNTLALDSLMSDLDPGSPAA